MLHHTRSVEKGLREIHRVLKPGGSLYLLLYGAGGIFWPLNYLLRPLPRLSGRMIWMSAVENAGYAANRRRSVLDDLFVPILETYTKEVSTNCCGCWFPAIAALDFRAARS